MKRDSSAVEEVRELPQISVGSICEFHDPKHGNANAQPVLGIVQSCELKAKGGSRVILTDAAGVKHAVAEKALHIVLPPSRGKATEPADILKDYADVLEHDPTELGIDPELLEMAWSECAESEKAAFTPKSVVSIIDESLAKTPLDLYRAFRLVSSDLGKVFFKALGNNEFKAKGEKAVEASKQNWCRAPEHEGSWDEVEWCFV
jgi:hypothetical protein